MGSAVLGEAISAIRAWSVGDVKGSPSGSADTFGSLVFNDSVQQARLPKPAYQALRRTITHGDPLDASSADAVAKAMMEWAIAHGTTHYTHWFQPLTGITAEKHDSFLSPNGNGKAVAEFSGKELIRGEPDARALSGGMRSPSKPRSLAWIRANGFIYGLRRSRCHSDGVLESRAGRPDKKTPLLHLDGIVSKRAVRAEAVRLDCRARRGDVRSRANFPLIDRYFPSRPDLINAGRALFGAKPPKAGTEDQQFRLDPRSRVMFRTSRGRGSQVGVRRPVNGARQPV
jgi:glutamine synthetase